MAATKKPFLLGIAGGSGSGKTTIARNLMSRMPSGSAVLLDHDSYYQDRSHLPPHERELINYDHPDALDNDLLVAHLGELIAGQSVEIPYYDFLTHTRTPQTRTVPSAPVIILEGILLFADERIRRLLDVKIFVETDADVRFLRRARRDIGSRGRTFEQVEEQYCATVRPMHIKFVEPSRKWADVLIPEGGNNRVALDLVTCKLLSVLQSRDDIPLHEGSEPATNGSDLAGGSRDAAEPRTSIAPPSVVT